MRIYGVLFTVGMLGGTMAIRAQGEQPALQGLPTYGVTLSGNLENPVIENHSGRVVIGYDVKFSDANGRGMAENRVMADSVQPEGIPDGGSVYVKGGLPINPTVPMPRPPEVRFNGQGPIVTAALRSVIFADGQFVPLWPSARVEIGAVTFDGQTTQSIDEQGAFEQFGQKLKAITEVGRLAQMQAWDQVEALYQAFFQRRQAPYLNVEDRILTTSRQLAAMRLMQTRKYQGEAAAGQLAQIYSSLPTVWK